MSDFMPDCRAKTLTGEWVEGEKVTALKQVCIVKTSVFLQAGQCDDDYNSRIIGDIYEVDPKTLGKNTTATMPDGSIVWEGDILLDELGQVFVVQWDAKRLCWIGGNQKYMISVDLYELLAFDNIKRISNRHDNPEVIGAK